MCNWWLPWHFAAIFQDRAQKYNSSKNLLYKSRDIDLWPLIGTCNASCDAAAGACHTRFIRASNHIRPHKSFRNVLSCNVVSVAVSHACSLRHARSQWTRILFVCVSVAVLILFLVSFALQLRSVHFVVVNRCVDVLLRGGFVVMHFLSSRSLP